MLVLDTVGAPSRRSLLRRGRRSEPEPDPAPVPTTRATVIDVRRRLAPAAAEQWLTGAGEEEVELAVTAVNRALHAHRLAAVDPYVTPVRREAAVVARVGVGSGDEVASGQWQQARELEAPATPRPRRRALLEPQARMAALLAGREAGLAGEELTLRARLDLDLGRGREAALEMLVALDAVLAELVSDGAVAAALTDRLADLRARREPVEAAAQAALAGPLNAAERTEVEEALSAVESALRARAAASGA